MDLLQQYNQDHPEAFREEKPSLLTDEYGREYSGMIVLVMRLSGGRIRDARRATMVLLIGCAVVAIVAAYLFISAIGGDVGTPVPYEQTYKPIQ